MARLNGRIIRPSSLKDRRIIRGALGLDFIRVPRRQNPFRVLRQLAKLSEGRGGDLATLKAMLARKTPAVPTELPDSTTEPRTDGEQRAA